MSRKRELPECIGSVFDCQNNTPACQNSAGFDFPTLWTVTLQYAQQCPDGPWLFKGGSNISLSKDQLAITDKVCKAIAGSGYKPYPAADVWSRLTQWKFPLFQLMANSPRPPLGFWVEDHLNNQLTLLGHGCIEADRRRLWKALAIIVDSFDEWGQNVADHAQEYLLAELTGLCKPAADCSVRQRYLRVCLQTADALAADRSTKSVPVVIAQAFFIGAVVVAMIRTVSASTTPTSPTYVNIEVYSIAFTAQYFWVIFAVIWKSIIGVSQSAAALPRILERFRWDLEKEVSPCGLNVNLPIEELDHDNRIYSGGIYSWQPARRCRQSTTLDLWTIVRAIIPPLIVFMAAATGQLISALVPPEGWSCRSTAMLYMFLAWLASYTTRWVPFFGRYKLQFWMTFVKDALVTCVTMGIVMWTQIGILNRCGCYTLNGRMGLQLPFIPAVHYILRSRLFGTYPAVVMVGISIQLIFVPALLLWRYHAAVQVFLQRDDGTSNLDWWYEFEEWWKTRWHAMVSRMYSTRRAEHAAAIQEQEKSIAVLCKICTVSTQESDMTIESRS